MCIFFCNSEDLPEDMKNSHAQIDLMIDRADKMMNLCEIKYSDGKYLLNKDELERIFLRRTLFKEETGVRSGVYLTMITPYGLVNNPNAMEIQSQVTMEDLFEE